MGDILILAILLSLTFLGYKKGFLKTLTGVVSIILSFVLAMTFSPQVESFIKSTPVYDAIYENIENSLFSQNNENKEEYSTAKLNMPYEMIENIQEDIEGTKNEIAKTLTEKLGDILVKILSILLIFLAVRILLLIILSGFGIIRKLPLIGWFDKLLGALFGFLKGLLVVYLLLAVVTVCTALNSENKLIKEINHSEFAKVMYNNNVFLDFVYKDWHKIRSVLQFYLKFFWRRQKWKLQ